jgi:hypothetical protein
MKKIILAVLLVLATFPLAAQTGCTPGGGVSCTSTLGLWLLPAHYTNWGVPWNANATALDTFAGSTILKAPAASQTILQPAGTYLNVNSMEFYGSPSWARFGVSASTPDSALTRTAAGEFSLDTTTAGNAAATLDLAGIKIGGGAGTPGQCLASDGTLVNTFVDCLTSANTKVGTQFRFLLHCL